MPLRALATPTIRPTTGSRPSFLGGAFRTRPEEVGFFFFFARIRRLRASAAVPCPAALCGFPCAVSSDGPGLLPEEPVVFEDEGYDPALSSDLRDKLQVEYEREWHIAQEVARRLQRALDVHATVTASRGEGSAPSNYSCQHLDDGVRAVNASLSALDRLKGQLLRAASPPVRAGAYARQLRPQVAPSTAAALSTILCPTSCLQSRLPPPGTWMSVSGSCERTAPSRRVR